MAQAFGTPANFGNISFFPPLFDWFAKLSVTTDDDNIRRRRLSGQQSRTLGVVVKLSSLRGVCPGINSRRTSATFYVRASDQLSSRRLLEFVVDNNYRRMRSRLVSMAVGCFIAMRGKGKVMLISEGQPKSRIRNQLWLQIL